MSEAEPQEGQNLLPNDRLRLHIDTFDPIPPELFAQLITSLAADLRFMGLDDLQIIKAGRGSTEIEMIVRQTAEANLKTAEINQGTAQIKRDTAKVMRDIAVIGGLVSAIGALAAGIKSGEAEAAAPVAAVMVQGNGAQCSLSVEDQLFVVKRKEMSVDPERLQALVASGKPALLRFSAKLSGDLAVSPQSIHGTIDMTVENMGDVRADFLQGQQLFYPASVEREVLEAYTSQIDDDPEIGPAIEVGFIDEQPKMEVTSLDVNALFEGDRFREGETIRLLLYFTYKNSKTQDFSAQIIIYELANAQDQEVLAIPSDALRFQSSQLELQRIANMHLK